MVSKTSTGYHVFNNIHNGLNGNEPHLLYWHLVKKRRRRNTGQGGIVVPASGPDVQEQKKTYKGNSVC
ncbi:MAG: hypothetical protein GF350_08185 [Chitinivibrionales bacterium]|nr:hypothetical protein [Chitinivibrionales bacterium]